MPSLLESESRPPAQAQPRERRRPSGLWTWAALLLAIVGVVLGADAVVKSRSERARLRATLQAADARATTAEERTRALEKDLATLKGQATVVADRLGLTRQELERARALARKTDEEQQQQLASLSGELGQAKADLTSQGQAIQQATTRLQSVIGDLGEQSGLIARNRDELAELRRTTERNYVEFDVKKSRESTPVGPVALRLKSSDPKRNRFTVVLTVDDKDIERKDKTLFEPIQFYRKGSHQLNEIVVYQLANGEVAGYLSEPNAGAAPATAGAAG